ncbi:flagellar assembly protein FliH [Caulobacter sp. KR2-114]|uniref:flagellar assembly protein FliH n=1 Tax=Caulobacter sp. KR2-114 TaxID=3400912 RepID=UPI003C0D9064
MSDAAPRKFTFDTVFDGAGNIASQPAPYKRVYTADEVEKIRNQARAEGLAAGQATAQAQTAQALMQVAEAARMALPTLAAAAHEHRVGSAGLALAAARKIADAACDRFPDAPIQEALAALAREIEAAPKLVVFAPADRLDEVQAALNETAGNIGYGGQIIARADPAMPRAAFVLDWGDGRAAFDPNAAAARVAEALEAALAAEGLHGEALTSGPSDHHG